MSKLYGTIKSTFTMYFTHTYGTDLKSLLVFSTTDGQLLWLPQVEVRKTDGIADNTNNRNYYPSVYAVTKYVDEQIQKALGNK